MRELLESIDSVELSEWLAYEQEYGLPDGYFMTAQLARATSRAMTGEDVPPGTYVPWYRPGDDAEPVDVDRHNMAVMGALAAVAEEKGVFRDG